MSTTFTKRARIAVAVQQGLSYGVLIYLMVKVHLAIAQCYADVAKPTDGIDMSGVGKAMCSLASGYGYNYYLVRWGVAYFATTAVLAAVLYVLVSRGKATTVATVEPEMVR